MSRLRCKRYDIYQKDNNKYLFSEFSLEDVSIGLGINVRSVRNIIDGLITIYSEKYKIVLRY
jgi:hypothetical protein